MNTYVFKTHTLDTYVVKADTIREAKGYLFDEDVTSQDVSEIVETSFMIRGVRKV